MKKILLIACLAVSIVTTVAIAKTSNETQAKKQVNAIGWNSTSHNHQSILLADISDSQQIPCQWCKKTQPAYSNWYICNNCGFRVCSQCTNKHYGPYKKSPDGSGQCSQCSRGQMIPATYKNGRIVKRP